MSSAKPVLLVHDGDRIGLAVAEVIREQALPLRELAGSSPVDEVVGAAFGSRAIVAVGDRFANHPAILSAAQMPGVEAHIVVYREERALKVPVGAVFREGAGSALFVVEGARARKRAVKVLRRNGAEAMIEDGVQPGERVVVYPSDALKDGSRVEIRPAR